MAAPVTNTVTPPDFTGVVNQQFFIEPQGGPQHPVSYLDVFPDTIYNKSVDSNLVALMYALLGPAGIGTLRQNYLLSRLAIEDNGLRTTDLDALYGNPFAFARLALETYEQNTEGLLTNAQWSQIQESDASYKRRAVNYLKAIRAGGTLQGLTLAARSGLDRPVEIVENYRALYDGYSDNPLGLDDLGVTNSTEEIIVLPRQDRPKSSLQTISIPGNALTGEFTLTLPLSEQPTSKLPYNATFDQISAALEALTVIGKNNVAVSGGPLPNNPIHVRFTNGLADTRLPPLLVTSNTVRTFENKEVPVVIEVEQAGSSADGEVAGISPEDWHYAQTAINNLKPMTTIVSHNTSAGLTKHQVPNATFTDSSFTEVLRYVTGKRDVPWPAMDSTHWIEKGIEHEAPVPKHGQKNHYVNFHNIQSVIAYTEKALLDENYSNALPTEGNAQIGPFSAHQRALFAILAEYTSTQEQFTAERGLANPPKPPTIQSVAEDTPLIEDSYPVDYVNLPKVAPRPSETAFWSSNERPEGSDYLEIDFGSVQAVNFLSFDATGKPYDIDVSYDLIDQSPKRRFLPVTYANPQDAASTLSIGYSISAATSVPKPWTPIVLNFTNALGGLIFTRFVRLKFTRRTGEGSPFTLSDGTNLPYSIEVQNLRLGRNVS